MGGKTKTKKRVQPKKKIRAPKVRRGAGSCRVALGPRTMCVRTHAIVRARVHEAALT